LKRRIRNIRATTLTGDPGTRAIASAVPIQARGEVHSLRILAEEWMTNYFINGKLQFVRWNYSASGSKS
jgi:hypothetical protein